MRFFTSFIFVFPLITGGTFFCFSEKQRISVSIPTIQPGKPLPADLFIQIGKKLQPSVVNISTTVRRGSGRNQDLFDLLFPNAPMQPQPFPDHSLGSGFIIDTEGHIVTNAHVVDKADSIRIQIKDDPAIYMAQVIGKDKATDIALIKIDIKDSRTRKQFQPADLGDSSKLQVGEWVAAFGNPFGHSNTMTKGIISAIDRHIDEINLLPFLQTDASINPGNSGGPLVNTQGKVIGVNTAINPHANNIGFAIPIYNVKAILKSLKKDGYVKRGFLGVQMDTNTYEFDHKGKSYKGVLITGVVKGAPAEKAGIQADDIIIEFNGTPTYSNRDLFKIVSATPVKEKVKGKLFRNQKIRSFTVVMQERPNSASKIQRSKAQKKSVSPEAPYNLGFKLAQANSQVPYSLNLPLTFANRPIVIDIEKSGFAAKAGLQKGDIIFSVNGKNVQTIEEAFKRLYSSKPNVLYVLRFDRPGRYGLKRINIIKN